MNCAERITPSLPRHGASESAPNWQYDLPADWRGLVVAPLDIDHFTEYEMSASRSLGYDQEGELCFYAHEFALEATRSDDDEEFYAVISHGETLRAWRLRDGRWLALRRLETGDDCAPARAFFTLAEQAPREARP